MVLEGDISVRHLHRMSTNYTFAHLWRITRKDGVQIFLTDHNNTIVFNGETYPSTQSWNASARDTESEVEGQTTSMSGAMQDNVVTLADVVAGRYEEAIVTEYLINWRFPWAGFMGSWEYWFDQFSYDGTKFNIEVSGPSRFLERMVGELMTQDCRYLLGGPGCLVDMTQPGFFVQTAVTDVGNGRTQFTPGAVPSHDRELPEPAVLLPYLDNMKNGSCEWTTGDNAGLTFDVHSSQDADIVLFLKTPFPIQLGDQLILKIGCDYSLDTCLRRFDNLANHGGFPYIPGTESALSQQGYTAGVDPAGTEIIRDPQDPTPNTP